MLYALLLQLFLLERFLLSNDFFLLRHQGALPPVVRFAFFQRILFEFLLCTRALRHCGQSLALASLFKVLEVAIAPLQQLFALKERHLTLLQLAISLVYGALSSPDLLLLKFGLQRVLRQLVLFFSQIILSSPHSG